MADLSLVEVRRALAAGELSAVEVTEAALERGERFAGYNLFITALPEQAREAAAAADRAWETDGPCGPLHGVPITVKDNIDVAGLPTTAGSPVFADRVATTDAPVVTQLRQAGAIVLGKTNLHELALGGTTMNPFHGTVPNAWQPEHIAGGSSGGSAAGVALGVGYASVGTDAAGSIRIPASCCGLVGFKPTHGLVPLRGLIPTGCEHTDHVGPLARSVADARAMLQVMAAPDPDDPHSCGRPASSAPPRDDLAGLRVGVPEAWFWDDLDPQVEAAALAVLDLMISNGATPSPVPMDILHLAPLLLLPLFVEAYVFHQPTLDACPELYSPDLRHQLMAGQYVLAQDYIRALRARRLVIEALRRAIDAVDVLAMPTLPIVPPRIADVQTPDVLELIRNTSVINQSGHPAVSLPMGLAAEGVPMGFQLVGQVHDDHGLLAVAEAVERLIGFDMSLLATRTGTATRN
ncbi:amidase [Pseudonocardia sp. CA-142604]|uniref:amidase n=1 Tax=Pseudonocardia sp. CA-142604 TaxID=3240024 RepID=UPI003D92A115